MRRGGYTLIELMVVIALIAIVAGVIVPALASLDAQVRPSDAGQAVRSLVARARSAALTSGTDVTLTIDPQSGRFWMSSPDTQGTLALAHGQTLVSNEPRVRFIAHRSGELDADGLAIRDGNRVTAIQFDRWTGEVPHGGR